MEKEKKTDLYPFRSINYLCWCTTRKQVTEMTADLIQSVLLLVCFEFNKEQNTSTNEK